MARYAFDIETDGLLDELTMIHSLVLTDVDTGETYSCTDHDYHHEAAKITSELTVKQGLELLEEADQLIGHNIIKFDIPAIQKVYPWFTFDIDKTFDTLVMSRLLWADLMDRDGKAVRLGRLTPRLRGSHGLEAWGMRLGEWKGDYSKEREAALIEIHKAEGLPKPTKKEILKYTWGTWNREMQVYCEQDVLVTCKFLELIEKRLTEDRRSVELEHSVAGIIAEQERTGFFFNKEKALELLQQLQQERADVESKLQTLFDPWYSATEVFTPKRSINYKDLTRHSVVAGAPYTKIKLNVFNPGSRAHIADRLMKVRGWKPSEFTSNGQPKVDDEILENLPYPEAQQIAYYLMLQKRLGQLAEGKNAWLNLLDEETDRLYGSVNTNGAVTGRMTHAYPNLAQVPSIKKPFGRECRALFGVPEGKLQVGVDVSGLELRMLAHFMAPHDQGAYGETVLHGDIHTANMEAAGLPDRDMAKTFIYAFLYGAGNAKIGSIVGKGAQAGGILKKRFLERTPALNKLIKGVSRVAKQRGYLTGLDGRLLHIRHQHAALNTLLQSAGALVCKRWLVEVEIERQRRGWQQRVKYIANIHDEHQYEVDAEIAEEWGQISIECIKRAGEYFGIRMPLDGEAKMGINWAECH